MQTDGSYQPVRCVPRGQLRLSVMLGMGMVNSVQVLAMYDSKFVLADASSYALGAILLLGCRRYQPVSCVPKAFSNSEKSEDTL